MVRARRGVAAYTADRESSPLNLAARGCPDCRRAGGGGSERQPHSRIYNPDSRPSRTGTICHIRFRGARTERSSGTGPSGEFGNHCDRCRVYDKMLVTPTGLRVARGLLSHRLACLPTPVRAPSPPPTPQNPSATLRTINPIRPHPLYALMANLIRPHHQSCDTAGIC